MQEAAVSPARARVPSSRFENLFILVLGVLGLLPIAYFITLKLPTVVQFYVGAIAIVAIAVVGRRLPQYRLAVLIASATMSARYLYWRLTETINFASPAAIFVSCLLMAAELYAVLVLLLGFFQSVETIERDPLPLPDDPGQWPSIDVYVPSFNESVDVLLPTLIGCKAMDYPRKKVYLLDDGRREEMRQLAARLGIHYLTRPDNKDAKAGNINAALARTDGELIAVFDADHIPTRAFLQMTAGFFQNRKVALVQTPHHFFNPDPFERNLKIYKDVPGEQDLFYHQVQPCNDFWNASYFCGSCAVLRRSALTEIGGVAADTVTEDCHTSLHLHSRGYESRYLNIPLAAGLAAERYSSYIKQRIRWARGMVQILKVDNPLTKKGLNWPQRLCYFNGMIHFLFGLPRLIFMIAPALYLLLNLNTLVATAFQVVAYAAPHIFVAIIANSIGSKNLRHSFWAEVYETSICFYTAMATAMALVRRDAGEFGVTAKGVSAAEGETTRGRYYDWKSSRPVLLLLLLNVVAVLAIPLNVATKPGEGSAIAINGVWAVYNLIILLACAFVALEQPQRRSVWRHKRRLPVRLMRNGDAAVWAETQDLATDGLQGVAPAGTEIPKTGRLELYYEYGGPFSVSFETLWTRPSAAGVEFGARFGALDFNQLCEVYRAIFGSASNWINAHYPEDRPLLSFLRVLGTPFRALAVSRGDGDDEAPWGNANGRNGNGSNGHGERRREPASTPVGPPPSERQWRTDRGPATPPVSR